jgi:hypothetical protein
LFIFFFFFCFFRCALPRLWVLARRYLPSPASEATSERAFSAAGEIAAAKRNRLQPERLAALIFCQQNALLDQSVSQFQSLSQK